MSCPVAGNEIVSNLMGISGWKQTTEDSAKLCALHAAECGRHVCGPHENLSDELQHCRLAPHMFIFFSSLIL